MNRSIYIIFSFALLMACQNKQEEPAKTDSTAANNNTVQVSAAQLKMAGIATGQIEKKNIASALKVNGRIDVPPQNMVSISFPLGGYLKTTRLLPGMHVNKGEVIAVMEDPQYIQLQQDYLTAKTRLVAAEKEYNRQKELNQSKAASDKAFEQSEAEYNSQQILVKSLSEKLLLIGVNADKLNAAAISRAVNIYSPITGFVSKVNVNIGKYVNPTDVLFEIVDPSDIHLALTVFEKDITAISVGQKVIAYTNNEIKRHTCKVILIGRDLSADRSVEVHCHFEDYDKTLIPGTFMNAEIEANNRQVLALPEDAVVRNENKQYIFVALSGNAFQMQEVKTGGRENGFVELAGDVGSLQNKSIVTKGAYALLMKMKNTEEE